MNIHSIENQPTAMKKLITLIALVLAGLMLAPQSSQASHMAGVDLTYTYTGTPNQYLVRLKFYRDCVGIDAPTQVTFCYYSASTGQSGTVTAPQAGFTPVPNTPCVTANPVCPGGVGDIEEYVYEAIINLPVAASDWEFTWADCCRNNAITTLQPNGMYVSARLDNITAPTNSSPTFSNLAYTRFCVGNQFFYDQGATDIDGDSLVFSLVTAEDGQFGACPNNPIPNTYIAPYSPTNFCASSIPITINSAAGVINFIPSQVQVAVMCVLVREYRNGVVIGSVKRDIQINIVQQCNQIFPSFSNGILTGANGQLVAACNDRQVVIPFDTTFQCGSAVPTDFRVLSPQGIPNPVINVQPINCSNGETDSVLVTFLNPLTVGSTYVWIKRGLDGNTLLSECGSEIPEFQDTVNIVVTDNSVWGPITDSLECLFDSFTVTLSDSVYCYSIANDGTDVQLVDGAGNTYPIDNVWGYCSPNGLKTNQILVEMAGFQSAPGTLYLIVQNAGGSDGNTIANDCGRFLSGTDTLAVLLIDNTTSADIVTDTTVCDGNVANLDATSNNATAYQWSTGATSPSINPTAAGLYLVTVSFQNCLSEDSVRVTVLPYPDAPNVACNPGSGNFKYIFVWSAVNGADSYEVSEDGGATWIPANQGGGNATSHGVNANLSGFLVRAVDADVPCSPGRNSDPAPCEIEIPNIFTPNGDGPALNEYFYIKNIEQYPNNTVQIFNRWGKEVFNGSGYNNDNVKFDGKDLPDGVYFYIIDLADGKEAKAGSVTIHR
ncbi:MAG: gliding motility-associated C-terminal domain-containing protein [Bacteroidota bacterium]